MIYQPGHPLDHVIRQPDKSFWRGQEPFGREVPTRLPISSGRKFNKPFSPAIYNINLDSIIQL
jgi:hypothetical protein